MHTRKTIRQALALATAAAGLATLSQPATAHASRDLLVQDVVAQVGLAHAFRADGFAARGPAPDASAQRTITLVRGDLGHAAVTFADGMALAAVGGQPGGPMSERMIRAARVLERSRLLPRSRRGEPRASLEPLSGRTAEVVGPDVIAVTVVRVVAGEAMTVDVLLAPAILDADLDIGELHDCMIGGPGWDWHPPTEDYLASGSDMIDDVSDDCQDWDGFTGWVWDLWEKLGGKNPYKDLVNDGSEGEGEGGEGEGEGPSEGEGEGEGPSEGEGEGE